MSVRKLRRIIDRWNLSDSHKGLGTEKLVLECGHSVCVRATRAPRLRTRCLDEKCRTSPTVSAAKFTMRREQARRRYRDARLQRQYDAYRYCFESGERGWTSPGVHGMWTVEGFRFRGASGHSAFWKGFDGLTRGGGPMYVATSLARMAYMAGRDVGRMAR